MKICNHYQGYYKWPIEAKFHFHKHIVPILPQVIVEIQFEPDNSIEYHCRTVLSPAPELGSKLWTQNGKRITIGVFRDEGRPTSIEPYSVVQWARYDRRLIIATSKPHYLRKDIEVELTNTCKPYIKTKVVNVFDNHGDSFYNRCLT